MKIVPLSTAQDSPSVVQLCDRLRPSSFTTQPPTEDLVRCPANLRAFEDAGEIDRIHAHGWRGPIDNWVDWYDWEPGNGTRYSLIYGKINESKFFLCLRLYGLGDRFMVISEPGYLHHTYIEEKLDTNTADAVAVLKFLDLMGHAVGYPRT